MSSDVNKKERQNWSGGAAVRIKDNFDDNQSYCNDRRKLSNQNCPILWRKPRLICRNIFAWSRSYFAWPPRIWIINYIISFNILLLFIIVFQMLIEKDNQCYYKIIFQRESLMLLRSYIFLASSLIHFLFKKRSR